MPKLIKPCLSRNAWILMTKGPSLL